VRDTSRTRRQPGPTALHRTGATTERKRRRKQDWRETCRLDIYEDSPQVTSTVPDATTSSTDSKVNIR
jgi:hypothetical protein